MEGNYNLPQNPVPAREVKATNHICIYIYIYTSCGGLFYDGGISFSGRPNLFAICNNTLANGGKGEGCLVEESSVALLC
jgi:hypothetical protein